MPCTTMLGKPSQDAPVLLQVEISEEVLQVPLAQELVALGVVEERRRVLTLERVVIVERVGIERDDVLRDLVLVRAAVSPDVCRLTQQIHDPLSSLSAPCLAPCALRAWNVHAGV
jgi:hypothetical protein